MLVRIKKIVYNPVYARMSYDLLVALGIGAFTWLLFYLFDLPNIQLVYIFLYPVAYIAANIIFGIYSRYKTASTFIKSIIIVCSAVVSPFLFYALGVFAPSLIVISLFTAILSILPRFFFNFYSRDKNKLFNILIHKKLPILVVGGAGYIGSHVIKKLLANRHQVRVFDKFIYGENSLKEFCGDKNLEILKGDTSDIYSLTLALNNVQAVIHLAGLVGDPACSIDDKLTRHINIISTRMLKETIKAYKIPKFIFASSCSVYGLVSEKVNENSSLNPVSLYAKTKIDSEQELLNEQHDDFHPTILRFATVYGHSPRMRFDLVANLFVAQAYNDGIITLTGADQWRPFIHVADVAEAIVKTFEAPPAKVSRQIFNVGDNSQNITIGDLAKLVSEIVGKDKNDNPVRIISKNDIGDKRNYSVSFDKIFKILDFKSSIVLEQGLREVYSNLKKGVYSKYYKDSIYSNFEVAKDLKDEFYSPDYQRTHYSLISDKDQKSSIDVEPKRR